MTDNTRGILLMLAAMAAYRFSDTFLKMMSAELPLFEALFLRGVGTSVLLFVVALWRGALHRRLPARDRGLIALRTLAEVGAAVCYIAALFHMPIANATALLQVLPLVLTLTGAAVFGAPLGWRRLAAILVGFAGVLLIVQPGVEGFNAWSLLVLVAVLFLTVRELTTRRVSARAPSLTMALMAALAVTTAGAGGAVFEEWVVPSPALWLPVAGASLAIVAGYQFSVAAMRVGDLAVVAPFRYSSLLWALILGIAIFGEFPAPLMLLGAGVVVGSGLFTFYRERALARRPAPG